jgi:outer membrane receptor protein involved in Fe transport
MLAPLGRDRLIPALTIRHLSSRLTAIKCTVPAVTLADATVTSRRIGGDFDLQFGVRNLLDKSYADPLSGEHVLPLLPRAGRTFFVRLTWQRE